jgi:penicillin G amidase
MRPALSYDSHGTPVIFADSPQAAYFGIGFVHGRHRPLQTLVVSAAGRGSLSHALFGRADLVAIDALAHRLDLPARGEQQAQLLSPRCREWLDAYVEGCAAAIAEHGLPWEMRALGLRLPSLTPASVLSGMMIAAFLGLAEGQERMELAVVDALAAGANPRLLEEMFAPHLAGWDVAGLQRLARRPPLGFAAHRPMRRASGSNAWAVAADRTRSGRAMLCGDPHLQVNQLPALFFELKAQVGETYWLGATIPGLPGIAVGRSQSVAWSGTFGCADNVDAVVERLQEPERLRPRQVTLRRRFRRALTLQFYETPNGTLETDEPSGGDVLALRWAGQDRAGEALEAYMALPLACSAAAAEELLTRAHTYSLHYVLADCDGDVRYCQAGRIPRRTGGWSGLYPVPAGGPAAWHGFYEGATLPRSAAVDGIVASANEARVAADGGVLATLAQPTYRLRRIEELLRGRRDHDVASMQALQLDLLSLQGLALRTRFQSVLEAGPLAAALRGWDGRYDEGSRGAHAFEIAYEAARRALRHELGGDWLEHMLETTELGVWWCEAFDRVLASECSWNGERGARLRAALGAVSHQLPEPWGQVQRLSMPNMILGGLPGILGYDRGPMPLPGCRATVRQGTVTHAGKLDQATAPAYRFICDFADEGAWTALPGGIDGSRWSATYDCWLSPWRDGAYHQLLPPSPREREEARQL